MNGCSSYRVITYHVDKQIFRLTPVFRVNGAGAQVFTADGKKKRLFEEASHLLIFVGRL